MKYVCFALYPAGWSCYNYECQRCCPAAVDLPSHHTRANLRDEPSLRRRSSVISRPPSCFNSSLCFGGGIKIVDLHQSSFIFGFEISLQEGRLMENLQISTNISLFYFQIRNVHLYCFSFLICYFSTFDLYMTFVFCFCDLCMTFAWVLYENLTFVLGLK